ncbi:MAG TPA: BMP family ABC transporter substrate-binding protein [Candidatus Mediterraneibacter intestinavium]|nr:BMP family ABC transporter substrate-binding protein [Candidatus Mediterraneibacter intestinavium]
MKKKLLAAFLCVAMVSSMIIGCGSNSSDTSSDSAAATDEGTDSAAEESNDALNIAIVSSPNGVDDGSFNEDNYNGILAFIEEHPDAQVTPIREETGVPATVVERITEIAGSYDVVVCLGFQCAGIGTVAQDNPDVDFILVDSYPTDAEGNTVELDNVYAMLFAEQESGFFAGMAAALETTTNKVAVVNGQPFPSNVNYQYGFEAGVNYANAKLGTSAEVVELASYAGTYNEENIGGNYTGNFSDEATGKVIGESLIKEGCDIIFVAAGASGNGVFTAAKEAGDVKVIGCDVDQYDDGANGDSNIMLTSVLKCMSINVERQLNAIVDGSFAGQNITLKADTDSTGYVKEEGRQQLSEDTIAAIDEAFELVKDGTIVPPSSDSDSTPEDFPGLE